MAYQFGKITWRGSYKGHSIEKAESPIQEVYIVDGDRKRAYWSMADARRAFYWLFDGVGRHAYVVTKKGPEYVEAIREIAKECDGVEISPDMR